MLVRLLGGFGFGFYWLHVLTNDFDFRGYGGLIARCCLVNLGFLWVCLGSLGWCFVVWLFCMWVLLCLLFVMFRLVWFGCSIVVFVV